MKKLSITMGFIMLWAGVSSAWASVGELTAVGPGGTFRLVIQQGSQTLLDENILFPTDLDDIKSPGLKKILLADALGTWQSDVYLEIMSSGGAVETTRLTNWFISASDGESLFDPANPDPISVSISNISVKDTVNAQPFLGNEDDYSVVYMMTYWGYYYEFAEARPWNAYGNAEFDVQVPGPEFLDGTNPYSFSSIGGTNVGDALSWTWQGIKNPGAGTTVATGTQPGQTGPGGVVYQMGLGVSIGGTWAPEPGTILLLLSGLPALIYRRKNAD